MGRCVPGPAPCGLVQHLGGPRQGAGLLQREAEEEAGVVVVGLARQVLFERCGGFCESSLSIEGRREIALLDSLEELARFCEQRIEFERAAKIDGRPDYVPGSPKRGPEIYQPGWVVRTAFESPLEMARRRRGRVALHPDQSQGRVDL